MRCNEQNVSSLITNSYTVFYVVAWRLQHIYLEVHSIFARNLTNLPHEGQYHMCVMCKSLSIHIGVSLQNIFHHKFMTLSSMKYFYLVRISNKGSNLFTTLWNKRRIEIIIKNIYIHKGGFKYYAHCTELQTNAAGSL